MAVAGPPAWPVHGVGEHAAGYQSIQFQQANDSFRSNGNLPLPTGLRPLAIKSCMQMHGRPANSVDRAPATPGAAVRARARP
jgi:hypothetical protein